MQFYDLGKQWVLPLSLLEFLISLRRCAYIDNRVSDFTNRPTTSLTLELLLSYLDTSKGYKEGIFINTL